MKRLILPALFALAGFAARAADHAPHPLSTVNFRGERLPVFATPQMIHPRKSVDPVYPGWELQAQIAGEATVTLLVGVDGKVSEVDILSSEPKASFGKAARAAALQWEYEPLVHDGQPTAFIVQQTMVFRGGKIVAPFARPVPARWK